MNEFQLHNAVLTFARRWAPISEGFEVSAELDTKFDGGEFSGPAIARAEERAWEELLDDVASNYALTLDELRDAINEETQRAQFEFIDELFKHQ